MHRAACLIVVLLAGTDLVAQSKDAPVTHPAPVAASSSVHAAPVKAAEPVKTAEPAKAPPPAPAKPAGANPEPSPVKAAGTAKDATPPDAATVAQRLASVAVVTHVVPAKTATAVKTPSATAGVPTTPDDDHANLVRVAKAVNAAVARRRAVAAPISRPARRRAVSVPPVPRYTVQWPSVDVRWNVAWPAAAEGFTLSWPAQAEATVVRSQ